MAGSVRDYSPDQITVSFGPVLLSDFSEGSMVKVAMKEQRRTTKVGADGNVTRVTNLNRLCEITVTLAQTSPANAALSAVLAAAELVGNSADIAPFLVEDRIGTTLIAISKAWVQKLPDVEFAKDATDRVWVFEGVADIYQVGGN